jgi:hypothetical protein
MGNIRDPSDDIVHQAKQHREDDGAGDPPNPQRC